MTPTTLLDGAGALFIFGAIQFSILSYLSHIICLISLIYLIISIEHPSFSILRLWKAALEGLLRILLLVSIILIRINAVFIGECIKNWPNLMNFANFLVKNGGKSSSNSFQISCIEFRAKTITWELIRTINKVFLLIKRYFKVIYTVKLR